MSEKKIDNSRFSINLESATKEDLVSFIQQSGVTNFEIRPFIEKHKSKFVFANTVSETDWDAFAKIINEQDSPLANFIPSFEVKKNNKIKDDDKKLLAMVGTSNRYTSNNIPDILKCQKKSKYLNLTESYSVLENLVEQFSGYVRFIEGFPHKTVQGKEHKAVHISTDFDRSKPVLMLIGGLHAREWIPQDALVYFVSDILQAYNTNSELGYGKYIVSFAELDAILEKIDLVVLPCANPDGRYFSQTKFPYQRKNMNASETGHIDILDMGRYVGPQIGVDLNRNYDIAWDFKELYDEKATMGASYDPTHNSYHGKSAGSENETINIIWLLNKFNTTQWLLDCHSYANKVLIPWGLEENQFTDSDKNIREKKYDKQRGIKGCLSNNYREYMLESDDNYLRKMGAGIAKSIMKSYGEVGFEVVDASSFHGNYYPGVLPDYAYCRHIVNDERSKIFSLTIETGRNPRDGFFPDLERALILKKEICAGILGLLSMIKNDV